MSNIEQNKIKTQIVEDSFKKFAKIDVEVKDLISGENDFRYRNKFAFPVQEVGGEVVVGMYRKNSHSIIPVNDCLLQSERAKEIVEIIKEYIKENKLSAYNETTKKGLDFCASKGRHSGQPWGQVHGLQKPFTLSSGSYQNHWPS